MEQEFAAVVQGQTNQNFVSVTLPDGVVPDRHHAVTIGRTYANLPKFNSATNNDVYRFAPAGEETAWRIIQNAISKARRFIYIEDQYFVSRRIKAALSNKLNDPAFQFVLVLMEASQPLDPRIVKLSSHILLPREMKYAMLF